MHCVSQLNDVTADTKHRLLTVLRHRSLYNPPQCVDHVTSRAAPTSHQLTTDIFMQTTPNLSSATILNLMTSKSVVSDRNSRRDNCCMTSSDVSTMPERLTNDVTWTSVVHERQHRRPFSSLQPVATNDCSRIQLTSITPKNSFTAVRTNQHRRSSSRDTGSGMTRTIAPGYISPLRKYSGRAIESDSREGDDVIVDDDDETMWRPW